MTTDFMERVWGLVKKIPRGRITTYGDIARALRKKGAARAVGNACNASPGMPSVPCHRVVKGNGELGGFAGGPRKKKALLEKEGIRVSRGRVEDLAGKRHRFPTSSPKKGSLKNLIGKFKTRKGFDKVKEHDEIVVGIR